MTQWYFWGDKKISDIYENIYVRTFVEDWFKIIEKIANEIKGKMLLDVGCGEGHTTKQVLDRITHNYVCDILEPNENALNSAGKFLSFENNVGTSYLATLSGFMPEKKYDTVFTSHTNYYWSVEDKDFKRQLDKLVNLVKKGGRLLILTLPEQSGHYKVMLRQIYPSFNYSRYIIDYYKKQGQSVRVIRFKMRLFVGDILANKHFYDLDNFYKFIHNTHSPPNADERVQFKGKLMKYQKEGYLDFKDELIIVSKN
jgi:ubiquinone/menaquinone biosynthesis C-methylase UbiE